VATPTGLNHKTVTVELGTHVRSLNWQLETEIEPDEIYKRALVDGTLNKQTKEEIQAAVRRAQEAFEIATQSLFKDASSYSFDSYQKALASPVNLMSAIAGPRLTVQRQSVIHRRISSRSGTRSLMPCCAGWEITVSAVTRQFV
jgi:hypothetical protein